MADRAGAPYLKVVRRRKPPSAKGMRGGSTRGGGGLGDLPLEFFRILSASMCVFNVLFMRLGTDFSHDFLLEKIFFGE